MAIIGGIDSFTSIPYMDMWPGLQQAIAILEGHWQVLWIQHHEHRLVLSRLFYCADILWFGGREIFLIVLNYLLTLAIFVVFYRMLQVMLRDSNDQFGVRILGWLILGILFSWIQNENLTWSIQSQFYLAQLLPIISFFLLYKSNRYDIYSSYYFLLACFTGFIAIGSMANGILTMPILVLIAITLGMSKTRIACLLTLGGLTTFLYLQDYIPAAQHGSFKDALLQHPTEMLRYVLLYLGGPFYHLTKIISESVGLTFAYMSGIILLGCSFFFTFSALKTPKESALTLSLLAFIGYVEITAIGTAGGRLIFGINQGLSSRYMTPVLMAWVALLILFAPSIQRGLVKHTGFAVTGLVMLQLLFLPTQLTALSDQSAKVFVKHIAALTLRLGINNSTLVAPIYPEALHILPIAQLANSKGIPIFDNILLDDPAQKLGQKVSINTSPDCIGHLDESSPLQVSEQTVEIRGWLAHPQHHTIPQGIYITDAKGTVIGYAVMSTSRPDVTEDSLSQSEFTGFIPVKQLGKPIIFKAIKPECELHTVVSALSLIMKNPLEYDVSSLAVALGIKDDKQLIAYPAAVIESMLVKTSAAQTTAVIFDNRLKIQQAVKILGQKERLKTPHQCQGRIEQFSFIEDNNQAMRVEGSITALNKPSSPTVLTISDEHGIIVGFAFMEPQLIQQTKQRIRFKGYLRSDQLGKTITLTTALANCHLTARVDPPLLSVEDSRSLDHKNLVDLSALQSSQWNSSDAQKTQRGGYTVFGSFDQAQDNNLSVQLNLRRGDALFYRSGSMGGTQRVSIVEKPALQQMLPVATEWVVIRFNDLSLPPRFTITITDEGRNKDEWSAIGLKSSSLK